MRIRIYSKRIALWADVIPRPSPDLHEAHMCHRSGRLADITPGYNPLSVARPDETPGHNPLGKNSL